jgi:hypothetical protein
LADHITDLLRLAVFEGDTDLLDLAHATFASVVSALAKVATDSDFFKVYSPAILHLASHPTDQQLGIFSLIVS